MLLCKVPKYPGAEMFRCRNIPVPKCSGAENSPCRNILVLKSPSARTSAAPNDACAEMFPWWDIRAEMTLAEMYVPKWSIGTGLMWRSNRSGLNFSFLQGIGSRKLIAQVGIKGTFIFMEERIKKNLTILGSLTRTKEYACDESQFRGHSDYLLLSSGE